MAYLKIEKIDNYDWLDKKIKYNTREDKRNYDENLLTHIGCLQDYELEQFRIVHDENYTKKYLAREFIQSFKAGDVTPELAHQIAVEFAEKFLDRFQVIVATHVDREHIHSHILFNNVSHFDFKCFYDSKRMLINARELNDAICKKYNIKTIMIKNIFSGDRSKEEKLEALKKKKTIPLRDTIKEIVDNSIKESVGNNFEYFIGKLQEKGLLVETHSKKTGNKLAHIKIKHQTSNKFIRLSSLGKDIYNEETINYILKTGNISALDNKRRKFKRTRKNFKEPTQPYNRYGFEFDFFKRNPLLKEMDKKLELLLDNFKASGDLRTRKLYINTRRAKDNIHAKFIENSNFNSMVRARNIIEDIAEEHQISYVLPHTDIYQNTKEMYENQVYQSNILDIIDDKIDKEIDEYIKYKDSYRDNNFIGKFISKVHITKKLQRIKTLKQQQNDIRKSMRVIKNYIEQKEKQEKIIKKNKDIER